MTSTRRPALVSVTLLAALMLTAATAAARTLHPFQSSFTGSATPAHSFTPAGVAVDPASNDLYVFDSAHKVIDKLSSSGAYLCQITGYGKSNPTPPGSECDTTAAGPGALTSATGQGAVGSAGELLFPDAGTAHAIDSFTATGRYLSRLVVPTSGNPAQVALDASGNLYVADPKNHLVDRYTVATETWSAFATATPAGPFEGTGPSGVAVDDDPASPSFGDVYVSDPANQAVDVFESGGAYLSRITATPSGPLSASLGKLATDPTDGHLFVPDTANSVLDEFASGGAFISQTSLPSLPTAASPQGVAINPATATLYVADRANNLIDVLATDSVPRVITGAPTEDEETTATLHGEVDPDGAGNVTSCRFEYVEAAKYHPGALHPYAEGQTAACSQPLPIEGAEDVSASITALSPGTAYHFRLAAANANTVPSPGEDQAFTAAGAPTIEAESANVVGRHVTLAAQVDPFGIDTTCQVQYVEESHFLQSGYAEATTLPCATEGLGQGFTARAAEALLTSLRLGTTYHYRFLATSESFATHRPRTVEGEDLTFSTFGPTGFSFEVLDEGGHPETAAAAHPYALRASFSIPAGKSANLKDVLTELPPGLIGNPTATPERCTRSQLVLIECSGATQVGRIRLDVGGADQESGLYNLLPPAGVAAEFGADFNGSEGYAAYIDARLRSGGDYGVDVESPDAIVPGGPILGVEVEMWGVPADPSHDARRACPDHEGEYREDCSAGVAPPYRPFLTNPTVCTGSLPVGLALDSWQAPGEFVDASAELPPITGCGAVRFEPTIQARPTTDVADSPAGLTSTSTSPSAKPANQGARSAARPPRPTSETPRSPCPKASSSTPPRPTASQGCSAAQLALHSPAPANCPDAAKIGTVEVDTPLLDHPLPGAVYLAKPYDNPFGSLLAIYVAVHDPESGVVIKLPARSNRPRRPAHHHLRRKPPAALRRLQARLLQRRPAPPAHPAPCGAYETTSALTPWPRPKATSPADRYADHPGPRRRRLPDHRAAEPNIPSF